MATIRVRRVGIDFRTQERGNNHDSFHIRAFLGDPGSQRPAHGKPADHDFLPQTVHQVDHVVGELQQFPAIYPAGLGAHAVFETMMG